MRHWRIVLLLSALGIGAFNTLLYIGLQSTTAINGSLMQTTMPLIIIAISYGLFRDTISLKQVFGIVFALIGAIFIIIRGDWQTLATLSLNPGDLWIFLAVVCYATYSSLLRSRPAIHPFSFLAVTFALGSLLLLPLYLWENLNGRIMSLNLVTALSVGYVAIFPSILAYLGSNRGVELVGANRAGLFIYLMPLFGSIMAMVFLGETLQFFHAIGMSLILVGILLVTNSRKV